MAQSYPHPPRSPSPSSNGGSDNGRGTDAYYQHTQSEQDIKAMPSPQSTVRRDRVQSTASSTAPSPDSRGSRLLDVSNMLNPSPTIKSFEQSKRSADDAHFETPVRVSHTPNQAPTTRSMPPSPVDHNEESPGTTTSTYGTFPRNVRRPVAPSSRLGGARPGILPMINTQQTTSRADTQESPFSAHWTPSAATTPRPYQDNLPSPAPSSHHHQHQHQSGGFPFPPLPHLNQQSRSRAASLSSNVASPLSSPFISNYAPPLVAQQSRQPLETPPIASYGSRYYDDQHGSPLTGQSSSVGTPRESYPFMHLSTAEGQITIPIDTQAASKVADEKRKRNAGASARFRQRRKERERDMGSRISELEQRLKVVEQERDHYRNLALKYAGAPLPNTASAPGPAPSRQNSQGLQLSPRLMAMANSQLLQNEPPYTSPAFGRHRNGESNNMLRSASAGGQGGSRSRPQSVSTPLGLGLRGLADFDGRVVSPIGDPRSRNASFSQHTIREERIQGGVVRESAVDTHYGSERRAHDQEWAQHHRERR